MATKITPIQLQEAARRGFDRMKRYRKARAMFIKAYVGHYYGQEYGMTGEEPMNLLFNAIRIMVPNLVMLNPKVNLTTNNLEQKNYAELLGLGVNNVFKSSEIKWPLRSWIVDALFGFGVMKTSISDSNNFIQIDDEYINLGEIYNKTVDLDNFTFDPFCSEYLFRGASFVGHASVVAREVLLNAKGVNKDLVVQLPTIHSDADKQDRVSNVSRQYEYGQEYAGQRDLVRITELWVPLANKIITIPDPRVSTFNDYIRQVDYYGPEEGLYTYLSFTPAVPGNPFPIAPVGIWYDMHEAANKVCRKILDQTERQKNVTVYNPANSDSAIDIRDAEDGDMVASSDPNGVKVISYNGQNPENENMLAQLMSWFSYMAGGIDQMGGTRSQAKSATQASIMQANSGVSLEDSKSIMYDRVAEIARKTAWYLHTDPLIDLPLTKRDGGEDVQLVLTPEQQTGDFLTLVFDMVARSFTRMDPTIRSKLMMDFGKAQINGVIQNNGFAEKKKVGNPQQDMNSQFQAGADNSQSVMQGAY